jgi:hypothetical protein
LDDILSRIYVRIFVNDRIIIGIAHGLITCSLDISLSKGVRNLTVYHISYDNSPYQVIDNNQLLHNDHMIVVSLPILYMAS